MALVARFVVRTDGTIILGKCLGPGLKPGHVYEVNEFLDELVIRDVGESCVGSSEVPTSERVTPTCWGNSISQICKEGSHLYTRAEWAERCRRSREEP